MEKLDKISFIKRFIEEVSIHFLREESPVIIQPGFENVRDIITLYAKQTNLLSSLLVLLENNFTEESYILLRSQINNFMLIEFLCNDDSSKKRYKEFTMQPIKNDYKFLKDLRKAIDKGWLNESDYPNRINKFNECKKELKRNGYDLKDKYSMIPLTLAGLAREDKLLFGIYISLYREASKHEHSDPTSLKVYRDQILDDYSSDEVFKMNLSKSNTNEELMILNMACNTYFITLSHLIKYLTNNHPHILDTYDKPKLIEIFVNAVLLDDTIDRDEYLNELISKYN
ncbi:DUF5677 domain-containing protein [Paenibacillus crassostreae]|uniref:Uncharacterized protein n=1 Tax=Paenibacillus crassostreae TaxID=1763538 RepID=A0A167BWG7_9BACL|nr:DUF5677 domain-containing protein [Paenibacillus crassostreae]AOZ92572.1 hypothetical protein LPB68_10210 [Paenibacillus crassostreae]OAB72521.1 hypothetical protein PNBC_16655 [Paenibacillus crassostreae]